MKRFPLFFQKNSPPQKMEPPNGIIYEFADFRLVPSEGLLLRGGERIPLSLKAFSTLVLLVERHGHLVQKAELIEEVWENSFVEEAAVSRCVWTIRNALGEDSRSSRFIQTIPRRGYRFVFPVSVVSDVSGAFRLADLPGCDENVTDRVVNAHASSIYEFDGRLREPEIVATVAPPSAQLISSDRKMTKRRMVAAVFTIATTLAVAALLGYLVYPTSSPGAANKILFAVLPFKPIDAANRSDFLELGVADALINRMNSIAGFMVRPLTATRGYAGIEQDPLAAGREQNVDYVLAGNYQTADGKIRITTQLYNVATGEVEQAETIEKEASGVFEIQNAVAAELGNKLMAKFGTRPNGSPAARVTNNEEAYGSYLLAQNFIEQRGLENGRKALEQIERAVALDPNFARAWATKAYIHRYFGYGAGAHDQYLKTKEAVEKALAIDPNLSEAYSALCLNRSRYEYDFAGAENACRRALELDPNSPLAHKLYANFLYTRGRFDESFAEIRKAMDLQPVSYDNQQTYALALYFARRYEEEEAQWRQLLELNRDHVPIASWLARSLQQQGREPEAFEYLIKKLTMEKADDETIERFKFAYKTAGWSGLTLARIKMAEAKPNPDWFELACLYSTTGNRDKAFENLERAYEQRSNKIAVLQVEPQLDLLRDDPRYADLIRRVEGK